MLLICLCGMIAAIVNAFTGVINSNISILGTVVCIVGFSIAIIAIVMLEKQRMKTEQRGESATK